MECNSLMKPPEWHCVYHPGKTLHSKSITCALKQFFPLDAAQIQISKGKETENKRKMNWNCRYHCPFSRWCCQCYRLYSVMHRRAVAINISFYICLFAGRICLRRTICISLCAADFFFFRFFLDL